MAPTAVATYPQVASEGVNTKLNAKNIVRTSGQHPPLYDQLKPYEAFPKHIDGKTVWHPEDYVNNPERWTHRFSSEEIVELGSAADSFKSSGTPLVTISKDAFPLPKIGAFLASVRDDLVNAKGFFLFKGLPTDEWGPHKSAIAYMGLGTHIGHFVSQNGRGHVLGHVKDLGEDPKQIDKVRIYRTNARWVLSGNRDGALNADAGHGRQFFHQDASDIVGLLCIARALEGGESDIVSLHHVFNTLQRTRPDVVKLLAEPIWYFDRKGEVSEGEDPYIRAPVLFLEREGLPGEEPRVTSHWDPYYVRSLTRFSDPPASLIPPLSAQQKEAMEVFEKTCQELSLHMILEVGDIQFVSNFQVLHARTAYKDHAPPAPRRHLMRLWLSVPEGDGEVDKEGNVYTGGWRLPFHDSQEQRRRGIQVNDQPAVANLDAD